MPLPRVFLSGEISFLALRKARSHSQHVAAQPNISRAQRCRVGKVSSISSGWLHQATWSNLSMARIAEPATEYVLSKIVVFGRKPVSLATVLLDENIC